MSELQALFADPKRIASLSDEAFGKLFAAFPWYRPLQYEARRRGVAMHPSAEIVTPWRSEGLCVSQEYDSEALMYLSTDDVIDRFLLTEDLRIVAEEGEPEGDLRLEADLSEEDELVSEELAEIYLAQGLKEEAKAIYRKLSLLNPEKSIYFAELIAKLEKQ
ncbi:MAG: hypothetical protein J6A66_07735 [Alistipes sp.]|nr:hypothetical protein [Alistipes sp.]